MKSITAEQVAAVLYTAANRLAPIIAFVITAAILTADLAYRLGYLLGSAVHARNDQLARLWVRLWVPPTTPPADPQPVSPVKPAAHPLYSLAGELETLTAKELRSILGINRKCSKRELVAMALAC